MKTKQIKGAVDILLVCGFPDLIHRPLIILKMLRNMRPEMKTEDWQFHCRLSEMTEEHASKIIDWDYWRTSLEMFKSLLEANGVMKENPYGKYEEAHKRHIVTGSWQEAEVNVFPPETTLVFIKQ